jgi:phosphate transport system substrate-binding protein
MKPVNSIIYKSAVAAIVVSIVFYAFTAKTTPAQAPAYTKQSAPTLRPHADLEGTISISGAFALYPLAVKWSEEFKKLYPAVKFDISAGGAGKGISDVLGGMVDLGAVSRDIYEEEKKKGAYPVIVSKDAVVATINIGNPNLKDILAKGISKSSFSNVFYSGTFKDWKQLGFSASAPIHVYTRSDASGAGETWAKFIDQKQEDLNGIGVFGDPGLLNAVKKDKAGIGFNNIAYAYDPKTKKQVQGIVVVPIDINNNGKIDPEENFYGSLDVLINAITLGKYPSPPARDLYFVSLHKPQKKIVVEFLKWVLTDGQKYAGESGYVRLPLEKQPPEL